MTLGERVETAGQLVRAGYDPRQTLRLVGLPEVNHIGLPPVTVQPAERSRADAAAPDEGA
jgi:hypothetical protein